MTYQTIYHANPSDRKFFFSTSHWQEFDDEDNFVPVSTVDSIEQTQVKMAEAGYEEILNPDPEFAPKELE